MQVFREMHTGAQLHERVVLAEVRKLLGEGRAVALIVYAYDRLARKQLHQAIIADELDRANVQLVSVTEGAVDNSALGNFLRSTYSFVAELEREKIAERTLRGKYARLRAGKIHSLGPELYGYRRDKDRGVRVIHVPEAQIVHRIFHLVVVESAGLLTVAKQLNDEGIASPWAAKGFGKSGWNATAVRNIIRNPSYKGETVQWLRRSVKKQMVARPESEHVRLPSGITPGVVTPEVWQRAQERLSLNKGEAKRNILLPYLLRGHIQCDKCGARMYPMPIGTRANYRRYYRCSSYVRRFAQRCGASVVPADSCEEWAWSKIKGYLQEPELIAKEIERVQSEGIDSQLLKDRVTMQNALERHDKGTQRLVKRLRDDDEELAEIIERELSQAKRERQALIKTLADLDARIETQEQAGANIKSLYEYCRKVEQELTTFEFDEQRLALEALGVGVLANGREWYINASIPYVVEPKTISSNCSRQICAPRAAFNLQAASFNGQGNVHASGHATEVFI